MGDANFTLVAPLRVLPVRVPQLRCGTEVHSYDVMIFPDPRIMHHHSPTHSTHYRGGGGGRGAGRVLGPAPGLQLELLGRADAPWGHLLPAGMSCFASAIHNLQAFKMGLVVKNPTCRCRDITDRA